MNIVVSPCGRLGLGDVFVYLRLIKAVLEKVREKHPRSPKMFIGIDDTACLHDFKFTGLMVSGRAKIECQKCHAVNHVAPAHPNQPITCVAETGECDG